jgi:molybdate transport system substrate-binding protein
LVMSLVMGLAMALVMASAHAQAATVNVAVAANFASTLQKIAPGFTQDTGHTLRATSGSSGKFAVQIKNGAPFHVLLSADADVPTRLIAEGYGAPTRFTYALGRLVLYSADPQRIDGRPEVLRRGDFKHLAIASPTVAPYGVAALQTLDKLGLSAALKSKLVQGENIAQTYQFVQSGNAELGFVALSQVMVDGQLTAAGSLWLVAPSLHQPIRQDALLLTAGQNNPAAVALMQYLQTDKARALIQAAGYALPVGKN